MSGARRAAERIADLAFEDPEAGYFVDGDLAEKAEKIITEETALRWTKTRPTEPGWYWLRLTLPTVSGRNEQFSEIVLLLKEEGGKRWMIRSAGIYGSQRTHEGEWAGPLEAPK